MNELAKKIDALIQRLRNVTCGELSCDACNERSEQAADELARLLAENERLEAENRELLARLRK